MLELSGVEARRARRLDTDEDLPGSSRRREASRRLATVEGLEGLLSFIEQLVGEAIEAGELPATADPKVLAFELDAIMIGADANSNTAAIESTNRREARLIVVECKARTLGRH